MLCFVEFACEEHCNNMFCFSSVFFFITRLHFLGTDFIVLLYLNFHPHFLLAKVFYSLPWVISISCAYLQQSWWYFCLAQHSLYHLHYNFIVFIINYFRGRRLFCAYSYFVWKYSLLYYPEPFVCLQMPYTSSYSLLLHNNLVAPSTLQFQRILLWFF